MLEPKDTRRFEEACEILREAQETLARRLSERIAAAREEILDDAEGATYLSAIGEVYDEVGGRLSHVQQMLNCLKQTAHPPEESSRVADGLAIFVELAREGDVDAAGRLLAELLKLEEARATECAAYFCRQLHDRPDFAAEAMQLRSAVQQGGVNDCLFGLTTCFDLQGDDLIRAFEGLKTR